MPANEITSVEVKPQPTVDVARIDTGAEAGAPGEETMEQYAARREAEMRGEKPAQPATPAAASTTESTAAATDTESAAATGDQDDAGKTISASATEDDPEKLIEESHPAKKGISKRMGELTRQREDAKAEAEAARAEAEAAKAEAQRAKDELEAARKAAEESAALAVSSVDDDPIPNREAYDDPDEYQAALTAYTARQEIRKANEKAQAEAKRRQEAAAAELEKRRQEQIQAQIADLHKTFNDRVTVAKAEYPDYETKVTNNEQLSLRNDVFFTIEQSELAPHILYHLADHPEEAAALNKLPPILAAMRVGEIQSEIRIARKPKPPRTRTPVTPIGGRSSPERKTPDEETMEEYAARREREEAEKRAAARRRAH